MPSRTAHRCARTSVLLLAGLLLLAFAAPVGAAPSPDVIRQKLAVPAPEGAAPIELERADLDGIRAVRTGPGRLPQLQVAVQGDETLPLPLESTRVFAELTGYIARVDVMQTYHNPFAEPIEAVYTFPLPENSAVDDLTIRIADRVIRAEIKKRDDARKTYEDAKQAGHTAALLEQERPNIFTQSVANIAPGESIEVSIRYVQHLTFDAGTYEFVFPMVVGPRFMPGAPTGQAGTGWSPDTTDVPDASRISPPVIGAGLRTGHDIDVEVIVDAGLPVLDFQTPTHAVDAYATADGTLHFQLGARDRIPNRDFVLRYRVGGDEPQVSAFAAEGPEAGSGVVSLVVQPPQLDVARLVGQREVIFVVDVSGSMSGVPLSQAKEAMRRALRALAPDDTFNVHTFAGHSTRLFDAARPANKTNIEHALRFIDSAQAGGGTYLADAVQNALSDVGPGRHRYVVFLTDGYVGNEKQIFAAAENLVRAQAQAGRKARVFGMGIGSSVNRHLIEGLAQAGDGAAMYVLMEEMPDAAIDRFYRTIDHPVLTDVRIDWGGLAVESVEPAVMPDLLATQPLVVLAKYTAPGKGTVRISGKLDGKDVTLPVQVTLPAPGAAADTRKAEALPSLWARARVETLSRRLWQGHDASAVEAITDLGLKYRLVTAYTSFVAVDRSRVVGDGDPKTVVQPVEAPAGVDTAMAMPAQGVVTLSGGSAAGFGGLGMSGTGAGGGGTGSGSMSFNVQAYGRGTIVRKEHKAPKLRIGAVGRRAGGDSGVMAGRAGGEAGEAAGVGTRSASRPQVRTAAPMVMGSIDKAVIQRVIRRHRNEVRYCYERRLQVLPTLKGKFSLKITIAPDGTVKAAVVADSTLGDEEVEQCVAQRAKRWKFPKSNSAGMVLVTYPFAFSPE